MTHERILAVLRKNVGSQQQSTAYSFTPALDDDIDSPLYNQSTRLTVSIKASPLSVNFSVCFSVSVYFSVCFSVRLSVCICLSLSLCLSLCLCVSLSLIHTSEIQNSVMTGVDGGHSLTTSIRPKWPWCFSTGGSSAGSSHLAQLEPTSQLRFFSSTWSRLESYTI